MSVGTHHRSVGKQVRGHARAMRRGATDAEAALWHLLRARRLSKGEIPAASPISELHSGFRLF
jgi:very-short-patch-repair endonuclease